MGSRIIRVVLILTAFLSSLSNVFGQGVVLGILEDNRGHYVGDPNFRSVRVVFEKKGTDWRSFQSDCQDQTCLRTVTSNYPLEVKWTISFDGKSLGPVTGRTPKDFAWYSSVGQQEIISDGPVPTIGKLGAYLDTVVYRPLVANSQPYFRDPDAWKPLAGSRELTAALQLAFRKKFPKLCRWNKADGGKLEPFPYRNDEVKLVKAYASKTARIVAQLHLEAIDCEDVEAGDDIEDPWFAVDSKASVRYLDSGMWLVDAGDYDNDGKSELVFSIYGENRGGYELFYDDFNKRTKFEFTHH